MSIKKQKGNFDFIVNYKDKDMFFIIKETLEKDMLNHIKDNEYFGIVTLNNIPNINLLSEIGKN